MPAATMIALKDRNRLPIELAVSRAMSSKPPAQSPERNAFSPADRISPCASASTSTSSPT